jgi:hypothetical protein
VELLHLVLLAYQACAHELTHRRLHARYMETVVKLVDRLLRALMAHSVRAG